eukprot:TRINITY_DN64449_c0_g1_i1.p1 TRINITY_DN64449_c0_g1~~TRINITY_DN64449_c0_g1_i1.p1  ORF type:complete len:201 (+),score=37.32 TRINITY_DN64449_c0_g1_i1:188-790(+)
MGCGSSVSGSQRYAVTEEPADDVSDAATTADVLVAHTNQLAEGRPDSGVFVEVSTATASVTPVVASQPRIARAASYRRVADPPSRDYFVEPAPERAPMPVGGTLLDQRDASVVGQERRRSVPMPPLPASGVAAGSATTTAPSIKKQTSIAVMVGEYWKKEFEDEKRINGGVPIARPMPAGAAATLGSTATSAKATTTAPS